MHAKTHSHAGSGRRQGRSASRGSPDFSGVAATSARAWAPFLEERLVAAQRRIQGTA